MNMEDAFVQRHIDILSDPRAFAVVQRGEHSGDAVDAAATIGQVHSGIDRRAVLGAGEMQQPRQCLCGHIIARAIDA